MVKALQMMEDPQPTLPKKQGVFPARDQTSIFYEVIGQGKPLIFCYGLLCRREHWKHQIEHFSPHYQVITFDYRGHQASMKPANDRNLTLRWCATDVQDLMTHLGLSETVCLGHSMGVPVLTQLAPLETKRLKGLVLICGSVTNPFQNMFFSNRMNGLYEKFAVLYDYAPQLANTLWQRFTEKNRLSYFLTSRFGFNAERVHSQDVEQYIEGVTQTPLSTFQAILRDYSQFDGRPLLKTNKQPTLVIAGEDDCITPVELLEEIASLLPNGKLETIVEGSHNAHMDFPLYVNRLIDDFLIGIQYK